MSSVAQDELSNLTNEQLRSRLLQYGLDNVPVTSSTRNVLIKKLRKTMEAQKSDSRRETMHVTPSHQTDEEKNDSRPMPASKKAANRRNTFNAMPMNTEDVVPISKPKNMRRSGRITPTLNDNINSAPIAVPPSENDIIELDEEYETSVRPKRTSRSPSLGKSQTVVTSYKTEVAKPIPIVESTEEDEDNSNEDEAGQNLYPSLSVNGFSSISPIKQLSSLRRTTTHTTNYEPTSYKTTYEPASYKTTYEPTSYKATFEPKYNDVTTFKAPLTKPSVASYMTSSTSELNRRYTTNTYNSKHLNQNYDDESGTEQSDIDAPYLSDFTKRLQKLRPEPLDRKIIADVMHHHKADDSLWQSFSNLVIAFGRKFGSIFLIGIGLMIVVFVYVFFIM